MRATVMYEAGDVQVEDVPDAQLIEPTDALVRITRAGICGSDLWPYKSMPHDDAGRRMGHEFIGAVEDVGSDVEMVEAGDLVLSPFLWSDGTCVFCREGLHTNCLHGGRYGFADVPGGQAEAVRVPQADGTLVVLPVGEDDELNAFAARSHRRDGDRPPRRARGEGRPRHDRRSGGRRRRRPLRRDRLEAPRGRRDHPARQQPAADNPRAGVRGDRRRA